MARRDSTADTPENKPGKLAQIRSAYTMTREQEPWIGLLLLGIVVVAVGIFLGVGFLIGSPIYWGILGLPIGLLVATIVFGRRVEHAAYSRIEGQLGAAASALQTLRRGWTVEPSVGVTRNQDVVHRVVGRPGIVLVGEGAPNRIANLLANEKRKHARVAPDTPIYDLVVGDGEGQVPLRKVSNHVMKLPRNLKQAEVTQVLNRLKALAANRQQVPIPKGPLPKGMKMPQMPTNPAQPETTGRRGRRSGR